MFPYVRVCEREREGRVGWLVTLALSSSLKCGSLEEEGSSDAVVLRDLFLHVVL